MRHIWRLFVAPVLAMTLVVLVLAMGMGFAAPVHAQQGVLSSTCSDTIVYGSDGGVHDWAWLQANWGKRIQCAELGSSVHHFHLSAVAIDISGNTNVSIYCSYADGSPCISQPATYSFPLLDEPSSALATIPTDYVTRYAIRGVTNKNLTLNGFLGFQQGSGTWINSDTGQGPLSVWMLSPTTPSDGITYTGWKPGTEHHGPVILYFKEVLGSTTVTATPTAWVTTATPVPIFTAGPSPTPGPTSTPGAAGSVDLAQTNSLLQQILDALKAIGAHLGVTIP